MSHVYHPDLDTYNEAAILQDGCPECEHRSRKGSDGLLELDADRRREIFRRVATGHEPAPSRCDQRLADAAYRFAVLLERGWDISIWQGGPAALPKGK